MCASQHPFFFKENISVVNSTAARRCYGGCGIRCQPCKLASNLGCGPRKAGLGPIFPVIFSSGTASVYHRSSVSVWWVSEWVSACLALHGGRFKAAEWFSGGVSPRTYRSRGTALLGLQEARGKQRLWGRRKNTISSCIGNALLFIGCEGSTYRLKLKTLNTKGQSFLTKITTEIFSLKKNGCCVCTHIHMHTYINVL